MQGGGCTRGHEQRLAPLDCRKGPGRGHDLGVPREGQQGRALEAVLREKAWIGQYLERRYRRDVERQIREIGTRRVQLPTRAEGQDERGREGTERAVARAVAAERVARAGGVRVDNGHAA